MKILNYTLILVISFLLLANDNLKAGPDFDPKITLNDNTDYAKEIKEIS